MDSISLKVIGRVRNSRKDVQDDFGWGSVESVIELSEEFVEGVVGLAEFSHVLVVFFMHRDTGEPVRIQRRPRGRGDMPMLGVFAQRGSNRPNPIGVTAASLVRVEPGGVVVRGLDAVDGTPVLDLKPYVPAFDLRGDARVPEWVTRLMEGYFFE